MGFLQAVITWFAQGGPIMWPILLFSVYGTTLCYERWMHYRRQERAISGRSERTADPQTNAAAFDQDTAVDRLARSVLANGRMSEGARMEKTRHAFQDEQSRLERHLGIISVVATLLPMLGLLGTVTGMIASFHAIAEHGTGNPRIVADGISEALITTEAGLITSIPLFYLHQVLSNRADALSRKLDEFTTHIVHAVTEQGDR